MATWPHIWKRSCKPESKRWICGPRKRIALWTISAGPLWGVDKLIHAEPACGTWMWLPHVGLRWCKCPLNTYMCSTDSTLRICMAIRKNYVTVWYDTCPSVTFHHNKYWWKHISGQHILEIQPSFWFGPQVFVAYANKNVVILFEFQTDNHKIYLWNFVWYLNHKFKRSQNVRQIVKILIDLPICSEQPKQWNNGGPNLEYGTLCRDVTTIS